MQKRRTGRIFGRERNQRRALLRGLAADLVEREKMTTTLAKAKELKKTIDPIINLGKRAHVSTSMIASVRRLAATLPEKTVVKLRDAEFIKRFEGRTSGYTRVVKLEPRKSDGAEMAVIEFV